MAANPWASVSWDGTGPELAQINGLYKNIFGREADADGLSYWDKTNADLGTIESEFLKSDEYKRKQQGLIEQQTRPAPPPGVTQVPGVQAEQPVNQFAAQPQPAQQPAQPAPFGGVEFDGTGPTLGEINDIYRRKLGREADADGLSYWDRSNLSYQDLESEFDRSDEAANKVFEQAGYDGTGPKLEEINKVYRDLLGRNADLEGLKANDLANIDINQVRKNIRQSEEFLAKNPEEKNFADFIKRTQQNRGVAAEDRETLLNAIREGRDLSQLYSSGTYADSVALLEDLGIGPSRFGKDNTIIVPASPTGYSGAWRFDPVFGSGYYKDAALELGKQLGLSEDDVRKEAGKLAVEKLYTENRSQREFLGGSGEVLLETLGERLLNKVGAAQETKDRVIPKLNEYATQIHRGLFSVSDSSGFFKQTFKDINKALGPIDDILVTALGSPIAGALYTGASTAIATGDIGAGLKAGGLSYIGGKVAPNLNSSISNSLTSAGVTPGIVNSALAGAGTAAALGGAAAALTGGDVGDAIIKGGLTGGVLGGVSGAAQRSSEQLGTGIKVPGNTADILGQSGGSADLGSGIQTSGLIANAANQIGQGLYVPSIQNNIEGYITEAGFVPKGEFNLGDPLSIVNNPAMLPNTVPQVGDQFSGVRFPGEGLDPNARGEGFNPDAQRNVDGVGGLGTGLTVETTVNGRDGYINENGVQVYGNPSVGDPESFINKPAPDPRDPRISPPMFDKILESIDVSDVASILDFVFSGNSPTTTTSLTPEEQATVSEVDDVVINAFSGNLGTPGQLAIQAGPSGPESRLNLDKLFGAGARDRLITNALSSRTS